MLSSHAWRVPSYYSYLTSIIYTPHNRPGTFSLIWINFNPDIDKKLHQLWSIIKSGMELLIHSQNYMVQPLKFGNRLVTSNLGSSSGSNSITIITIINLFKWNPRQNQRRASDYMENIKTTNAILKFKVKRLIIYCWKYNFSRWSPSPYLIWRSELRKIIKST